MRSSGGRPRKLKCVARGTSFRVERTLLRTLRASALVVLFTWTSGTGASYVAKAGIPRAAVGAVRIALPPVDFLAACIVLAISKDVLDLVTEPARLAGDEIGATSSDTRWILKRSQRVTVSNVCSRARVLLWVSGCRVHVCPSRVSKQERKRRRRRRSSGRRFSYEKVAGWPRRRQTRSADIIIGSERIAQASPRHPIRGSMPCPGQLSLLEPREDEDWLRGARVVTARVLRALLLPLRYTSGAIRLCA